MQLKRALLASLGATIAALSAPGPARADGVAELDTSHTLYHESPFRTNMTVYTPSAGLRASPAPFLDVRGGWEADVVSGASVSTKAGSVYQNLHPAADVVTTASVRDLRNVAKGGFTVKNDTVSLSPGYTYSTENDYKSHTVDVAARTDLFEHNTQLELAYAHNFDRVCDRVQSANATPSRFRAMENSDGCFTSAALDRRTRDVALDGFQGSWTQAWTPVFATQLVYSAQVIHGFQSNPYRSIILGEGIKSQEHHPENRAREALALRANFYLRPLRSALRVMARGYWDTWDVKSVTGEAEFEKYFGESFRAQLRGRVYRQSGALFWSDDYTGGDAPLGPKGQYFTGDRELSPFTSVLVGLRATYTVTPERGRLLGMMRSLKLTASGDAMQFDYDEYTLGGSTISNARAYVLGLAASAVF